MCKELLLRYTLYLNSENFMGRNSFPLAIHLERLIAFLWYEIYLLVYTDWTHLPLDRWEWRKMNYLCSIIMAIFCYFVRSLDTLPQETERFSHGNIQFQNSHAGCYSKFWQRIVCGVSNFSLRKQYKPLHNWWWGWVIVTLCALQTAVHLLPSSDHDSL